MKKHNFSAGPCILPQEVLKKASEAVVNFNGIDLSLIEISHRSKDFVEVMEHARQLVKDLLKLPDGYSVLFLQGGASLGFLMAAYNLMKVDGKAAYVDTGAWSSKAIYAGAQKNMGPAGTTLVVVKDEILGKTGRTIPTMLDYRTHIKKDSMFNTPPVFPVYVSMLTLEWLKSLGGVKAIEKINEEKAAVLYAEIDRNPLFKGFAAKEDRSSMNVTFNLKEGANKEIFDKLWNDAGISGIKGHRSVGGYRASIYNAMPLSSVKTLVEVMQEFERKS